MELKLINKNKIDKTPLSFINFLNGYLKNTEYRLEFSIYESGGKGVTRYRDIFHLDSRFDINAKLKKLISELPENKELAIHSRIYIKNELYHIPLIDFSERVADIQIVYSELANIFKKDKYFLFDSGRSYHCYSLQLLKEKEWIIYMGSLLLLNDFPKENIDSRWIGHSLENGFCALRMTCNSDFYLKTPELVLDLKNVYNNVFLSVI